MAVDANFASLLDNLKVEDPWLPPTTWESIPSQNGARVSSSLPPNSSPPQPPLHRPSSVSEASLVRLALNALQGMQSALLSIENLSAAFCSDPADRSYHQIPSLWNRSSSTHALGKILNSIGCLGSLVFLLRKFVDNFMYMNVDVRSSGNGYEHSESVCESQNDSNVQKQEHLSYSLVNQAFAVAVGKVLDGYICSLNTVYASARLRRSSKIVDVALQESYEEACLTSIVHSKVTLLEVYMHTKELRTRIEALGNICNLYNIALSFSVISLEELTAKAVLEFSNFYRGGYLLTYLYMQLKVADPAHHALLKFLFLRSCEPYCEFIRSWIFRAETSDPYKEFIVERIDNPPADLHCNAGVPFDFPSASVRDGVAVPCFLKDFLIPVIRAGQQLQVLKKLLELCNYGGPGDYTYEDFLPICSGYLSDDLFCASPMTFSKGHLEAMVTARNNHYRKLLEKLENLLTKLEFRYQQVVPHGAMPIFVDSSGGSLKSEVSFTLNDGLIVPSTANKCSSNVAADKTGSNHSNTRDEFYWLDTSDVSECSSLSGSEEHVDAEQLSEHPNSLVGQEQRYLSSLRFSISIPIDNTLQKNPQSEMSRDLESNLPQDCLKNYALSYFVQSYHNKKTFSHMFVPPGLRESNLPRMSDSQYTDWLTNKCWSIDFPNILFCDDEGYRSYWRLHQWNSALEVNKEDMESINEGLPYFSKMTSTMDVSIESLGEDQIANGFHTSNSSALQPWKDNYHSSFFSRNPMLRKNAFFHPTNKPGKKCSTVYGRSLPCFDFSTVEVPCNVSVEKLAGSSGQEFESQLPSPDPTDSKKQDQEGHITTNLLGGRNWESLLSNYSFTEKESAGQHKEGLLAMFQIPLDIIIDKCLLQEILFQYKYVSKLSIKLLEGFDLYEHLLALRRYYFMEVADWTDLFIMSLWHHKWCALEADQRVSVIQGFLELSVQRSSCERDPNKDRLFVYIKGNSVMPLSTSAIGVHSFDFLGLGYRVDWPVSIVLTPSALKIYADIFNFLIQVKLAVFSLTDVWSSLKDLIHFISKRSRSAAHEREVNQFNMLIKMRHQVNHFISTLQQYVQSQLSHISWCRFLHNLKYKVKDMMDLELVHMEYLTDSLNICFLSDETRSVASIIESILQCALDLRSCLTTSIWDVGLYQEDSLGKLSRINMSQVLSIKQKFNKNLKELHLCYLKSPRHGKFGLSCFWGYLNYNQYYTDS
ncbi:uncharacterized protein LOC110648730 isoform X2 [Hevea brasiliensis]|uniref:uncharacterized protein LOC110648730 isoform X2 n=1 Tax=Hevea brasiliensis TaxID=3981 RepID=UPI0025D66A10|nr:uncharacterized protein LOC110648730 isoform X2 [Hevea brasiliensis]